MELKLLYAIILTILPITELRVGLPIAILYAKENGIPLIIIFLFILLINLILIFLIFLFLDFLHERLMNLKFYKKFFNFYLKRFQKRVDKFEKRHEALGFLALVIFVAIPLPGTGAWSGCLVSWILGLERKKSILFISVGIIIAGLLIFLGTLGFLRAF